jgi:hypothetical protein
MRITVPAAYAPYIERELARLAEEIVLDQRLRAGDAAIAKALGRPVVTRGFVPDALIDGEATGRVAVVIAEQPASAAA